MLRMEPRTPRIWGLVFHFWFLKFRRLFKWKLLPGACFAQRFSITHWLRPTLCNSVGLNYVSRQLWPAVFLPFHTVLSLEECLGGGLSFSARLAVVKFGHCYYPPDIHLFKPDTASFQACKKYPCKVLGGTQENWHPIYSDYVCRYME